MRPEIQIPKNQNLRFELMTLAKPFKTPSLTGTYTNLARQEAADQVFGQVCKQTKPFLKSQPEPLAGYPDPLLTLEN